MESTNIDVRGPPTLDRLPTETVEEIAMYLNEARDLFNFRAVCKEIEFKTHRLFLRTFFRSRTIDWFLKGLTKLLTFVTHKDFKTTIKNIRFIQDKKNPRL
jgi:hypothetical protein